MTTWSISANPNPVNEDAGSTTLTITRSSGSGSATVYVSTLNGVESFSTNNGDYNGLNDQQVTFASGATSEQITLGIDNPGLTSGTKTFGLLVQSSATSSLTTDVLANGSFTIDDNDAPPTSVYSISANPNPVNEDAGSTTLTITRSSGSGSATVYVSTLNAVDSFSTNSGDYNGFNDQEVTFASGATSEQITLGIDNPGLTSGTKTFGLLVQSIATSSLTTDVLANGSFTIDDNDAPPPTPVYSISANPNPVNEDAGSTTLTITRSSGSGSATVYVSTLNAVDSFSTNSGDYNGFNDQEVTFASGATSEQITLGIDNPGLTSGTKTFGLLVQSIATSSLTTDVLANGSFTIVNNDAPPPTPVYSISPNPASIDENAGTFTFTISRTNFSQAATVYVSTVHDQGYDNDQNNTYYQGLDDQQINFAATQATATVQLSIHDLGLQSGSEAFRLIVQQNPTNPVSTSLATDTFTIVNNDAPPPTPVYSISPNPASIDENAGTFTFTISRTNFSQAATVYVSTVHDQGYDNDQNNTYYQGLDDQQINFAATQATATVQLSIHDLGLQSGSEAFRLIVQQNPTNPVSTSLATDTFTIVNNDAPPPTPVYSISPNPASIDENAGTFTFTISRTNFSQAATVYVSTVHDQGYDNDQNNTYYQGLDDQQINFAATQATATVQLSIHDLGLQSGSEAFRLIVQQNPTNPVSTSLATDTFTIVNNDAPPPTPVYSISPNPASIDENAGTFTFTISRTNFSQAATVYVSTVHDQGYDNDQNNTYYQGLDDQQINFAATQATATVQLSIHDLGLQSGSEAFRLIVQQNPTNPVSTSLASDTFTIVNNDPSAATAIATAESKITQDVQTSTSSNPNQSPDYLDDPPLVATIAAQIAADFNSSHNYIIDSVDYINLAELSPNDLAYDQCVSLVMGLDQNVPHLTGRWSSHPSLQIDMSNSSNPLISVGAPIATFDVSGGVFSYPNGDDSSVEPHAGIFLGYGCEAGQPGFFMLDQYIDQPIIPVNQHAEVRFHPFNSEAVNYYAIVPSTLFSS